MVELLRPGADEDVMLDSSPKYSDGSRTRMSTDDTGGMSLMNRTGRPSFVT